MKFSSSHIFPFSPVLQIPLVQFITSSYPSISSRFSSFLSIRLSVFGIQWACEIAQIAVAYVWPVTERERGGGERREIFCSNTSEPFLPPRNHTQTQKHTHSCKTASPISPPLPPSLIHLSSYSTPPPLFPTPQHLHHFALESGVTSLNYHTKPRVIKPPDHATASSDKTSTSTNLQVSLALTRGKVWCFRFVFAQTFVNNSLLGVFWIYIRNNNQKKFIYVLTLILVSKPLWHLFFLSN